MKYISLLVSSALVCALAACSHVPLKAAEGKTQTVEGAKGAALPVTLISSEVRAPIESGLTPEQFRIRLASGGTVVLGGADLVIGSPNLKKNDVTFLALDSLEMKRGARIVTGGNTLVIFVNKLISEDGSIVSFKDDTRGAASGGPGGPGDSGVAGGLVSIHIVEKLTGILHVDLSGQDGGKGGDSTVLGAAGPNGSKGDQAISGTFGCSKGGGNGTPGAPGGIGGTGGDGGAAGAGGTLELFNVGGEPIPAASYTFSAKPGHGGAPGAGGPGGPGGKGGDGGDGAGFCNGGSPGANGGVGPVGAAGHPGSSEVASGNAIVKNMDLEIIRQAEPKRQVFKIQ